MHVPDLSARIAQLEAQLAELFHARASERQTLDTLRQALDYDAATGAFSRRYFETQLANELRRIRRDGYDRPASPLSFAIVDVDHFKQINDRAGHWAGDQALREVVVICRQHLRRNSDVVSRYGGDEFALLMPSTPIESAAQVAELIRRTVQEFRLKDARLGVSIGIASCPQHGRTAKALFQAADSALYRAKQTRNTVVCAA